MKARPILFSAPMVRALLDGRKSQTRRVVKPRDYAWMDEHQGLREPDNAERCPYGKPGDRLWVRETWADCGGYFRYAATDDIHELRKKRSPIFMPRVASRITLEITDVRVERLQDISEADARAEGAKSMDIVSGRQTLDPNSRQGSCVSHYRTIWESINGIESWPLNPWVWVLVFRRLEVPA